MWECPWRVACSAMRLYWAAMVGMRKVLQCAWIRLPAWRRERCSSRHLRPEQVIVCFEGW